MTPTFYGTSHDEKSEKKATELRKRLQILNSKDIRSAMKAER